MFFNNIATFFGILSDQTGKKISKVKDSGSKLRYNSSINIFPFYFLLEQRILLDADFSSLVMDQVTEDYQQSILASDRLLAIKSLTLDKTLSFYQSYSNKFAESSSDAAWDNVLLEEKDSEIIDNYISQLRHGKTLKEKPDLLVIFEDQKEHMLNLESGLESLEILVVKETESGVFDNTHYKNQLYRYQDEYRSVHILKDQRLSSYDFLSKLLDHSTGLVFIYKNPFANRDQNANLDRNDEEIITKHVRHVIPKQSISFYERIVAQTNDKSHKFSKIDIDTEVKPQAVQDFNSVIGSGMAEKDSDDGQKISLEPTYNQDEKKLETNLNELQPKIVEQAQGQEGDNQIANINDDKRQTSSTYFPLHYSIHYNWADIINNQSRGNNLVYGNLPIPTTGTQNLEACFGSAPDEPTPEPELITPDTTSPTSPYFLDITDLLKQIDSDFLNRDYASIDSNHRAPIKTYLSADNLEQIGQSLFPNRNKSDIIGLGVNLQEVQLGNLQDKLNLIVFNNKQGSDDKVHNLLQEMLAIPYKNSLDVDYFINQNDFRSKANIKPVDNLIGKSLSNRSRMIYIDDFKPSYSSNPKLDKIDAKKINEYIQPVALTSSLANPQQITIPKLPINQQEQVASLDDSAGESLKAEPDSDDKVELIVKDDYNLDRLSRLISWLKKEGINEEILKGLISELIVDNNRAEIFDILENIFINKKGEKLLIDQNNNHWVKNLLQS